ncbi:MAG: phosphatase PAP2 family protein [Bacteroidales bacterium]|nr:phosphatase PAP2 family protein [Bacteroidales bacterium]
MTLFFACGMASAQFGEHLLHAAASGCTAEAGYAGRGELAGIVVPALLTTGYTVVSLKSPALRQLDNRLKIRLHERGYITRYKLDDYLQFSPAAAAFGMKAAGVKSTHRLRDMIILYSLSQLLETGVVHALKNVTSRPRPDGSANNSFPSGHTATAFVAAEFLRREYAGHSVWTGVGGYVMASLVGVSRILNNRHWASDVIAGAGVGVVSVKTVYWAYPLLQGAFCKRDTKRLQSFVYPSYIDGAFCLNFSCMF